MAMCLMVFSVSAQQGQGQGQGQRQGQGRSFGVNIDELPGITADQKAKIEKIRTTQREESQKLFGTMTREQMQAMTQAQREERTKKMTELNEKTEKEIKAVLTPAQVKVYEEKQAELEKARAERAAQRAAQGGQGQGQGQRNAQ